MADARDEKVWTNHAREHLDIKEPHKVGGNYILRERLLKLENVTNVLDLGCGSSLWRLLFEGFNYTGADQNEAMISAAKKRFPNDNFIVTNARNTCFTDESFDLVFTAAVLQHNTHADKEDFLKEVHRILRPGGYYLCTENTFREDNYKLVFGNSIYADNLTDGYSFTPNGWKRFLLERGFDRVWFEEPSEYLYIKI